MVIANEKIAEKADKVADKGLEKEKVEGIEKIEAAKSAGIRFIQLQFTDIIGHVKAVTIPVHQLEGSVRHGTWFDGSSIEGFTRIAESDQYL
ncbi:MAG TPA: glutamine synthetase, partial [Candidatus Limnocylindrales bacterium]|nr:glutamine synthetase [Candidatus Limnocylindrales bacterium]